MRLKQMEVFPAYEAVLELGKIPMPYQQAREVAALRRRLREECDTIVERLAALQKELGVKPEGENDPETLKRLQTLWNQQMAEAAEMDLPRVDLCGIAETLNISPNALAALGGVVSFERE